MPVEWIRISVSLVAKNAMNSKIDKKCPRSEDHFRISDHAVGWENKLFYFNSFFNRVVERFTSGEHPIINYDVKQNDETHSIHSPKCAFRFQD